MGVVLDKVAFAELLFDALLVVVADGVGAAAATTVSELVGAKLAWTCCTADAMADPDAALLICAIIAAV